MMKHKLINSTEYEVLKEWFNFIETKLKVKTDIIIYLKTSPEKAMERVLSRGREEEKNITLQYLQEIHQFHENWLSKENDNQTNIITLNGDLDLIQIKGEYDKCISQVIE